MAARAKPTLPQTETTTPMKVLNATSLSCAGVLGGVCCSITSTLLGWYPSKERERKEERIQQNAELVASHAFNKVTQRSLVTTTNVALFDQDYKDARASNNLCVVSIGSYSTSRPDTFSLYFFLQPFTPDRRVYFRFSFSFFSLFFSTSLRAATSIHLGSTLFHNT